MIQLDLFEEYDELQMIRYEMEQNRVREGKAYRMFTRKIEGLSKEILKLNEELERIRGILLK